MMHYWFDSSEQQTAKLYHELELVGHFDHLSCCDGFPCLYLRGVNIQDTQDYIQEVLFVSSGGG